MDKKFEELKLKLFELGRDYIEEFIGFEYSYDWGDATIEDTMNEIYKQMPEDELNIFYKKFNPILMLT